MGDIRCRVVVSVDTEEDIWGWSSDAPVTCTNVLELPGLLQFFSRLGVRPTFFVTYRVLSDPSARAVIRELAGEEGIEIGCHVHPWNTPPDDGSPRRTILHNYPRDVQASKIASATRLFEDVLGRHPTSFRAGRFGFGSETAACLIDQGYRVDSSVTPFFDWTASSGGQNYLGAPLEIYRFSPDGGVLTEDPGGGLVEVPLTSGYTRLAPDSWGGLTKVLASRTARIVRLGSVGAWLLGFRKTILSPESHGVGDMVALGTRVVRSGVGHLHLFFHSSSLLPGLTPFVRTPRDLDRLYHRTEAVLERFQALYEVEFASVTDVAGLCALEPTYPPVPEREPLRAVPSSAPPATPTAEAESEALEGPGPRGTMARLGYLVRYLYWRLGGYRRYRRVQWSGVKRLVFVCSGNICRSPYAERAARAQALDAVSVGVKTRLDGVADPMALQVARDRGISMDGHRTMPLEHFRPRDGDLFVAMEPFQAALVAGQPWAASHQITLLGLWAGSRGPVIPDPYGGDEQRFNSCFSLIDRGIATMRGRLEVPPQGRLQRWLSSHDAS